MKSVSVYLIFIFIIEIICQNNDDKFSGMSFLGLPKEYLSACPDGLILMQREIGVRPSDENYWIGVIYLTNYENLNEARIRLHLTHPANLEVNKNYTKVWKHDDKTFLLEPLDPSNNIIFKVQADKGKPFPNIANVTLNEEIVCRDPKKMNPVMAGSNTKAISGDEADPWSDFSPYCGRAIIKPNELIVRGNKTKPGDWPWHVAIYYRPDSNSKTMIYRCGGTIISFETIITAAHCVVNDYDEVMSVENFVVIAGKYNLNMRDRWNQQRDVISIKIGENFSRQTLRNDIAVLTTNKKFDFNDYVQRICIWTDYNSDRDTSKYRVFGANGIIAGWGINENRVSSEKLMSTNLQIISDTDCLMSYPSFYQQFIHNNSFCAGGIINGTSPCNGDSGGGLVIPIKQVDGKISYFLRGIVSVSVSREDFNSRRICNPNFYTVFTDVAQFTKWI